VKNLDEIPLTLEETEIPEKTTEQIPEKTIEQTPEKTTEQTPEKTIEQIPEKTTEQILEKTTEQIPEKTIEQILEKTTEQIPEKTTEQIPEKTTQQTPVKTPEKNDSKIQPPEQQKSEDQPVVQVIKAIPSKAQRRIMLIQRRREKRLAHTTYEDIGKIRLEWFTVSQVVEAVENTRGCLTPELPESDQKWMHTYFFDFMCIEAVMSAIKVLPVKLNLRDFPGVLPGGNTDKKHKKGKKI